MAKRKGFQKILIVIARISYVAAVVCGVVALYMGVGSGDPVVASFMASAVFFAGVGVVLQVIGSTDLPDLKIDR